MRTYKRLTFLLVTILGLAGVVVAVAPGTVFDLDGNSALDHGLPDWNQLNGTTGFNGSPGGSLVRSASGLLARFPIPGPHALALLADGKSPGGNAIVRL